DSPGGSAQGSGGIGTGGAEAGSGGNNAATGGAESGSGGNDAGAGGGSGEAKGFGQTIEGGGTQGDFFAFELTIDGKSYNVQTNPWGGADQVITAGGDAVFRVDSFQEPAGGQPWDVAAFPSVYIGSAFGGANPTTDSG